jgi:biopolymer transport protein ExbD
MPKMKIHRKSTSIDMTAMCDVAFLLLSFFIFTAKFKKSEEVAIITPTSVSTDSLSAKNKFNIYCNIAPNGAVLMEFENDTLMRDFATILNDRKQLQLSKDDIFAFGTKTSMGMPLVEIKPYLSKVLSGQTDMIQTGIPVKDTATSEFGEWIDAAGVLLGDLKKKNDEVSLNVLIKADNKTPYEVVDKVMLAFMSKGNSDFKLITTPKDAPMGTALYQKIKEEKSKAN